MDNKELNTTNATLAEKELETVSGGIEWSLFPGDIVVDNLSSYSSGNTPKYKVGDILTIKYKVTLGPTYDCTCAVLKVSSEKHAGMCCREFYYTVEIIEVPENVALLRRNIVGSIYDLVFESCLYER